MRTDTHLCCSVCQHAERISCKAFLYLHQQDVAESTGRLTKPPSSSPAMVPPSAPHTGLLPQYGPSGFLFRLLSKRRYVQKQMAAPSGRVGSLDADCHADLNTQF